MLLPIKSGTCSIKLMRLFRRPFRLQWTLFLVILMQVMLLLDQAVEAFLPRALLEVLRKVKNIKEPESLRHQSYTYRLRQRIDHALNNEDYRYVPDSPPPPQVNPESQSPQSGALIQMVSQPSQTLSPSTASVSPPHPVASSQPNQPVRQTLTKQPKNISSVIIGLWNIIAAIAAAQAATRVGAAMMPPSSTELAGIPTAPMTLGLVPAQVYNGQAAMPPLYGQPPPPQPQYGGQTMQYQNPIAMTQQYPLGTVIDTHTRQYPSYPNPLAATQPAVTQMSQQYPTNPTQPPQQNPSNPTQLSQQYPTNHDTQPPQQYLNNQNFTQPPQQYPNNQNPTQLPQQYPNNHNTQPPQQYPTNPTQPPQQYPNNETPAATTQPPQNSPPIQTSSTVPPQPDYNPPPLSTAGHNTPKQEHRTQSANGRMMQKNQPTPKRHEKPTITTTTTSSVRNYDDPLVAAFRRAEVNTLNQFRREVWAESSDIQALLRVSTTNELPKLCLNEVLSREAQRYANKMAIFKQSGHEVGGTTPDQRYKDHPSFIGENVAEVDEIVTEGGRGQPDRMAMANSQKSSGLLREDRGFPEKGHYVNMVNPAAKSVGIGVWWATKPDGFTYWYSVQLFSDSDECKQGPQEMFRRSDYRKPR